VKIGITCYPTYGGSGIVATELGIELANRGHEVHFISYANPIRLDTENPLTHYHEVQVSTYPLFQFPPYCLALASCMADVAEHYSLDLLHVHYAVPHSVSALLAREMVARRRRLPFVTTLHGTDITLVGLERSYFAITKFSIEMSNGVTAVSQYLSDKTVEVFGIDKEIRVIRNFVNCDIYRPLPLPKPANPYAPPGERVLLHLSNFRPVKRALDCLSILNEVRKKLKVHLLMVGDGPDRGPAENLARALGLEEHVTFLGKQNHVERLIPYADVLLLPSQLEAFGLAALEAMACGVPPVATRAGGVPELITDGVDGFLEEPGDIYRQAWRVLSLLTDDALYARISAAARRTAKERFCSTHIIPLYEQYYQSICSL